MRFIIFKIQSKKWHCDYKGIWDCNDAYIIAVLGVSGAQGLRDINLCRKITRLIELCLKAHNLKVRMYWDHTLEYKYSLGQVEKANCLLKIGG